MRYSSSRAHAMVLVSMLALPLAAACRGGGGTSESSYPAPRYPRSLAQVQETRLLESARKAVRQTAGRSPLGQMLTGQQVHVFVQYGQDQRVWDAVKEAWRERGVEAHAVGFWDIMGITKLEYDERMKNNVVHGNEAWKELGVFRDQYRPFFPEDIQKSFGSPLTDDYVRRTYVPGYLDKHPEVQHFYAGEGGGNFWARAIGPAHEKKFMGNWIYIRAIDLVGKTNEFPGDLWNLVDDKVVRPVKHVTEVTFTDPEGTKLHWTLTPEQSEAWSHSTGSEGHLNVYPSPLRSTLTEGVIRAAANHTGFYPTMTVHLSRNGRVERIEGGGKTGELFRMLVEHPKMKQAQFPTAPESGYWFLSQDGFGTNPKFVRNMSALVEGAPYLSNLSERNRAGVQHFAFSHPARSEDPRDIAYAKEQGLPLEHTSHMHVYFPTIRWKLRDTGEWLTVADKGYATVFGDPEVRALAGRYGDPAQILSYEWIPDIPGVNVPGDYDHDYSREPWTWLLTQWQKAQNGTYEYYVND